MLLREPWVRELLNHDGDARKVALVGSSSPYVFSFFPFFSSFFLPSRLEPVTSSSEDTFAVRGKVVRRSERLERYFPVSFFFFPCFATGFCFLLYERKISKGIAALLISRNLRL